MNTWTAYLAIAVAGLTSLVAVWMLTVGARPARYQRGDVATSDNRQRLDDIDRKITLLTRYVEEQIPRVVIDGMRTQLAKITIPAPNESEARLATETNDDGPIIREIAHSLNTPLAQIEASVLSMRGTTDEQRRKLEGILDGVRVSKSFLTAFHEVGTLTLDSQAWSPDSLCEALRAAARIYAERRGREARIDVQMPDSVPGYSNSYVMAILLPLLENALEAVPTTGTVHVQGEPVGDSFRLCVCNDSAESALPADIYSEGYTTKEGHDGLGLPTVRRLLTSREAHLRHQVEAGKAIFTIDLPRGRREY